MWYSWLVLKGLHNDIQMFTDSDSYNISDITLLRSEITEKQLDKRMLHSYSLSQSANDFILSVLMSQI